MAEGMEIFFKKLNYYHLKNNLLENETKGHIKKSFLSQFELFLTPPQSSRMQSVKKTRNQYSML